MRVYPSLWSWVIVVFFCQGQLWATSASPDPDFPALRTSILYSLPPPGRSFRLYDEWSLHADLLPLFSPWKSYFSLGAEYRFHEAYGLQMELGFSNQHLKPIDLLVEEKQYWRLRLIGYRYTKGRKSRRPYQAFYGLHLTYAPEQIVRQNDFIVSGEKNIYYESARIKRQTYILGGRIGRKIRLGNNLRLEIFGAAGVKYVSTRHQQLKNPSFDPRPISSLVKGRSINLLNLVFPASPNSRTEGGYTGLDLELGVKVVYAFQQVISYH